jgi:K+-transporting ATPase ATPase C chain
MQVLKTFRTALLLFILLSFITGIIYPLVITAIGQTAFVDKANGSLIELHGKLVGSSLIGQPFSAPGYFWGRPSATTPFPYNAANSGASNLGPTNPVYLAQVQAAVIAMEKANPNANTPVPIDLVTASGSGLDPDISPEAAYYQASRVAKARNLSLLQVRDLIKQHITYRQLGFLGEPRVNVLELNLSLDALYPNT